MDWALIKREYITTGISLRALAKKHGASFSTIQKKSASEKWTEARKKCGDRAEEKSIEKMSDRMAEARDILYEAALNMARQLAVITAEGEYPTGWKPKDVSGALKDCRELLEIRSEEDMDEQKARIAKLKKEIDEAKEEGKVVTIRFEGEAEKWAT